MSDRARLHYASFVSLDNKFAYVEIPKCASSAIKNWLKGVEGTPWQFDAHTPETKRSMFIHNRDHFRLPSFASLDGATLKRIAKDPDFLIFAVVRHPIERFFSAWKDKVFLAEPEFDLFRDEREARGESFVRFRTFADYVLAHDAPATCNTHWRSQFRLMFGDQVPYTQLYDVRDIGRLQGDLRDHFEKLGRAWPTDIPQVNEGLRLDIQDFVDQATAAHLADFYAEDFAHLGYALGDYPARVPDADGFVNQYTDAIFERNRVIELHTRAQRKAARSRGVKSLMRRQVGHLRW